MQAEGPRSPVALNSQEGSGNTWLRGLLEKATGMCTGFYARDTDMRAHGFLGEGVQECTCSGSQDTCSYTKVDR